MKLVAQILDAVEWQTAKSLTYPNITMCSSKMFSKRKMQGKQI